MKFDVLINGRNTQLELNGASFKYEDRERNYSIEQTSSGVYSVLIEGHSYEAVVLSTGEIQVNGHIFSVEVFDPRELRSKPAGGDAAGRQNVTAPMPGKVIRLLKSVGDPVEAGQGLIVVEAMKMQNEMKAPKAGRVVEVKTRDGATVAAGDVLVVVE